MDITTIGGDVKVEQNGVISIFKQNPEQKRLIRARTYSHGGRYDDHRDHSFASESFAY